MTHVLRKRVWRVGYVLNLRKEKQGMGVSGFKIFCTAQRKTSSASKTTANILLGLGEDYSWMATWITFYFLNVLICSYRSSKFNDYIPYETMMMNYNVDYYQDLPGAKLLAIQLDYKTPRFYLSSLNFFRVF